MQVIGVVFNIIPKVEYYNDNNDNVKVGDFCIAETARGNEFCKVVEIAKNKTANVNILRKASKDDIKKNDENLQLAIQVKLKIKTFVARYKLNMKVCKCEYLFDRDKLIIHYTADDRVDFRELVKALANELKVRIEMHQINSRDETQCMGALGCCGRVCCCKNHLCDFDKVSIKMAKRQGLSLNPQKLNGVCGKLMCCLRYEDEFYEEMTAKMPKLNSTVTTPDGDGMVKSFDCIKATVDVLFIKGDEFERKTYALDDLKFKAKNNE